ncbi:ABC-three component system protein [Bacillus thuringiensis]|uniref:ABC-three component system protein n=1 Tax=Bacillus thuringiensis TaxID=1428 RepID=UPI002FBE03E7
MSTYSKYEQLAVKIHCLKFNGSGCLFQPFTTEYSYVITAKHCLEGTDDIPQCFSANDIKIFTDKDGTIGQIKVLDYYLHNQLDLAVITVEYVDGLPSTLVTIPKENQVVGVYGFPNILKNDIESNISGHRLKCTLNFLYPNKNIIEFTPDSDVGNIINTINETIVGFSGSGIFYEKNDNLYLTGIFTELKEENGAFNSLLGHDISAVNQILSNNHLPLLIPEDLLNFEKYIETAFESNEGFIKPVLKKNARSLLDLQPHNIVTSYNEKLYLPYNAFIEEELLNLKLWEGWLSLLTYYYMDTNILPTKSNFNLVRNRDGYDHYIRMYFTAFKRLSNCIMDLFVNNYDELGKNDVIVINTQDGSPGTKSCNKDKTKRVLRQIDRGDREKLIEKGIEIDNPEHLKGIEFIHIDLFKDKFAIHDELEEPSELEDKLKESIKEVFNNVP